MRIEEKFPHVFSPIRIGSHVMKNRIQYTPMVSCLSTVKGEVTTEYVDFVEAQARTGAAIVTIGETCINNENAVAVPGELDITTDDCLPGLFRLVEGAHKHGAKISIELCHGGRGAYEPMMQTPYALAPSNFPLPQGPRLIKEMDQVDMDKVIKDYCDCAERCKKAGFDMILIHAAHGNLIGQFLSPATNHRTDCYGGPIENRMRFPLDLLKAVRERVGPNFTIDMRMCGDEIIPDGLKLPDAIAFLKEAQKYIDCVQMSRGLIVHPEYAFYVIPPYYHGYCHNVQYAEAVKPHLDIPVSVVGSITSIADAEEIIASGKADFVGMARAMLADYNLIKNARFGDEADTRPCLRCMEGCCKNSGVGWPIRCAVNPVLGQETRYYKLPKAEEKKKVMIVGGGPAGMMAAQTLTARGHDVVLYEKQDRLGGLLCDISSYSFKNDLRRYLAWNVRTTERCGARIVLGTAVTPEIVEQEAPDALVLAVGGSLINPPIPGLDGENVLSVLEVERNPERVGKKVVVCGGGISGLECALSLAMDGRDVTVVDMVPAERFAGDMVGITRNNLMCLLKEHKVKMVGNSRVDKITGEGVECINTATNRVFFEADTVVTAFGVRPNFDTVEQLSHLVQETYIVGDCSKAGNILHANHSSFHCTAEV